MKGLSPCMATRDYQAVEAAPGRLSGPERHDRRPAGFLTRWWQPIVIATAALVLIWQLFVPPIVGVADNGDFGKMIARYNLGHYTPSWGYLGARYDFDGHYHYDSGFASSELLPIRIALAVNRLISKDGAFDLRLIGFFHATMYLLAFALFVPLLADAAIGLRLGFCALVLFVFYDVMYVGFLNSFYMDAVTLAALLLAVAFYLRALRWRRPADTWLLLVSCLLLVTSKPQYAFFGLWFAVLFWIGRDVLLAGRTRAALAVCALLMLAVWATVRFGGPRTYTAKSAFNVIFSQILPTSKNVDGAMAELGLDDSYKVWIGKHAYSPGSRLEDPEFYEPFLQKTSFARIGWFYLKHPADAYRALRTALDEAGRQRPAMGTFDASAGLPEFAESQAFAFWSNMKQRWFHNHAPRLIFVFAGLALLAGSLLTVARKTLPQGAFAGGCVLIGMAVSDLLVSSLGDVLDQPRHHLIFFALCDLLVLTIVWLAMQRIWPSIPEGARHKSGWELEPEPRS